VLDVGLINNIYRIGVYLFLIGVVLAFGGLGIAWLIHTYDMLFWTFPGLFIMIIGGFIGMIARYLDDLFNPRRPIEVRIVR
jgi:hypothetical protein